MEVKTKKRNIITKSYTRTNECKCWHAKSKHKTR